MSYRNLALTFEAEDRAVEAAWAYEVAIHEDNADVSLHWNLAALYLTCSDFGYSSQHQLPAEFIEATYDRAMEILHLAETRYGWHDETEFWRLYLGERVLGENIAEDDYRRLLQRGNSPMPYVRLYVGSGGTEYQEQAKSIYGQMRNGVTARERLVMSILKSSALPKII